MKPEPAALAPRHTLGSLFRTGFARVLSLDEGLIYTAKALTIRPGRAVRDYLAGQTRQYTHPISYFFIAIGFFALMTRLFSGPTGAGEGDQLFAVLVVPFVAVASRVLLWRADYTFAEHLIVLLYLAAQVLLLLAILFIGVPLVPRVSAGDYAAAALVLAFVYFVWGYSQSFLKRPLVAALAGVLALTTGAIVWFVATAILVSLLRR